MADGKAITDLLRRLDSFGLSPGYLRDRAGPAVYHVEPPYLSGVICPKCGHVAVIPKLPARPLLVWTCSGCMSSLRLEPPPAVLAAGLPSARLS